MIGKGARRNLSLVCNPCEWRAVAFVVVVVVIVAAVVLVVGNGVGLGLGVTPSRAFADVPSV